MPLLITFCAFISLPLQVLGQTRTELAMRFGSPRSEIFLLAQNVMLTVTYDGSDRVCVYRIETANHSERVAPNLTDARYWIESRQVTQLIAELIPEGARRGAIQSQTVGLRVGEYMLIESDETVQITRIQRSRPLLITPEIPVADRLVKILWKRPECLSMVQIR